jgi:hypothetical protein
MSLWKKLSGGGGANDPLLRCSFCNKTQRDVPVLVAGPNSYICDGCIGICVEVVARQNLPPHPDPAAVFCLACGDQAALRDTARVGPHGVLCRGCVVLLQASLNEAGWAETQ